VASNDPLFVADLAELKARLRLTGVPASSPDTLAIIDEAVLRARITFYRELGERRVTQLKAITYTINPTTEDGILRALANSVEIDLVRIVLLELLPNTFMDASGDANKRWNEEGLWRERGPSDLRAEILRIQNSVIESMQMLALEEVLDDETSLKGFTISPLVTSPRPGDSLLLPLWPSTTPQD
jgi:hypothetical protein